MFKSVNCSHAEFILHLDIKGDLYNMLILYLWSIFTLVLNDIIGIGYLYFTHYMSQVVIPWYGVATFSPWILKGDLNNLA